MDASVPQVLEQIVEAVFSLLFFVYVPVPLLWKSSLWRLCWCLRNALTAHCVLRITQFGGVCAVVAMVVASVAFSPALFTLGNLIIPSSCPFWLSCSVSSPEENTEMGFFWRLLHRFSWSPFVSGSRWLHWEMASGRRSSFCTCWTRQPIHIMRQSRRFF